MKRFLLPVITLLCICACTKGLEGEAETNPGIGDINENQSLTKGPVTLNLEGVTATTVTFTASLDVDMMADYQEVGLVWSTEDDLDVESKTITKIQINKESYSETFTGLSYDTDYYYTVYALRNNVYSYGETQTFKTDDIAINIDDIKVTNTTATFVGKVMRDEADASVKVGIQYSADNSFGSVKTLDVEPDEDGAYSVACDGLAIATEYCCRTYVCQNGVYEYSETMTFTTNAVSVELEVESNTQTIVQFKGKLDPYTATDEVEIAILINTSETVTKNNYSKKYTLTAEDIKMDGSFDVSMSGLKFGTTYYYTYYVLNNGVYSYGTIQNFQTEDHPYNVQSDYDMDSATDLSSSASANCYIVSSAGLYKFKTVKGNSSESVGSVASASILWETFGMSVTPDYFDLIDGICYKDGYIAFNTADSFKEGNAVIAAKDADGNILWSWHIWLTDQPQEHVYKNNAGTMMDRNLGATSATAGDVGALGLLYQWGRKDPFLGSSRISDAVEAKSTITWSSPVKSNASAGTIEYATANPTTFITYNSYNYDWYYTGSLFTDDTRWTTSSSSKSIFDPCPAGWRVPDGGINGVWEKAGFDDTTYDGTNEGISFSISSPFATWYPASGYRYGRDGSLGGVGGSGNYWSASPDSDYAYRLSFSNNGYVSPSNSNHRASSNSVRCLQESK